MRHLTLFRAAAIFVLCAACSSPNASVAPTPSSATGLSQQGGARTVPFELRTLAGGTSTVMPGGLFEPAPAHCPVLLQYFETQAIATHLGLVSVRQYHCIDGVSLAFTDGVALDMAANGDELHVRYRGTLVPTSDPTQFEIEGTWEFVGGTGRFAGVTGSGVADGETSFASGATTLRLSGTMTYPGTTP